MQRWKKRLWTSGLVGASVLLIIAAVMMGSVRLVDLIAPRYRQTLANNLTEAIEQPVEVGRIGMSWRSLRPTVELNEVLVLNPDSRLPVFKLSRIQVPFKWTALLQGEFEPAEVVLTGAAVTLEWRPDGSLGVQGIEMLSRGGQDAELDLADIFRQMRQLGHVELKDCELAWREFGDPIELNHLTDLNAELDASAGDYSLDIEARLPPHLGTELRLQAFVEAEADRLEELETSIQLQARGLSVQGWLQPVLKPGLTLRGDDATVEIESSWRGLQPTHAHLRLVAPQQAHWQDTELLQMLPGLSADLSLRAAEEQDGWNARINALQYTDAAGGSPVSSGELSYHALAGGFGTQFSGRLDVARVSDLLGWSSVLGIAQGMPVPKESAGELQQFVFAYSALPGSPPEVKLKAAIRDLSIPVTGPVPGVSGLNGDLVYDNQLGRIRLRSKAGQLIVPQVFENPVPLTDLNALLTFQRKTSSWALTSESLALQADTVTAKGALAFEVFDKERSPEIDLQLDFAATDVRPAKALIPKAPVLPLEVSEWLKASILAGRVPQGEMVLRGALSDFPYTGADKDKGEFRVEFDVEEGQIDYAPGWPQVSKVQGHAVFAGQSMFIDAHSGELLGVPVTKVKAKISDFEKPLLRIDGRVEASLERQLEFLAESPFREDYQGLLDVLTVEGPGALDLTLKLPLANLDDSRVNGDIHARGARLDFADLQHPVTDLRGTLQFTEQGLSGSGIQGRFLELPATADLTPAQSGSGAGTRLDARLTVSLPEDSQRLQQLLGEAAPLHYFEGKTEVRLSTVFDASGESGRLQLSSDLQGMSSHLGAPLRKEASDQRDLRVGILPASERLLLDWDYANALHGRVEFLAAGDDWQFQRGILQLGNLPEGVKQPPPLPAEPGWHVTGDLPILELPALSQDREDSFPQIAALDVHIGLLKALGQNLRDINLRLQPSKQGLILTGTDAEGRLDWIRQNGRLQMKGDFKRLSLSVPEAVTSEAPVQSTPLDPARLPGLDLQAQKFILGNQVLGSLKLSAQPIANGLRLTELNIAGKEQQISGSGEWLRPQDKSNGKLVLKIKSEDIDDLLKAGDFAPNIEARQADISADVFWRPHAGGLVMDSLNGNIAITIKDGSLLAVDPGAGRVLSLLSFYSLPRRLTLDFSDVMGKGTAFDKLHGNFRIEDGNAFTDDKLKVTSPSMDMEVRGRIGLAARDYDQTVTIQPEVSSGVALAGAVIGGPVLGIGLWIAQELLDEPFEQATKLSYHLGGSWDEPEIEPLKAEPRSSGKDRRKKPGTDQAESEPPASGPRK